MLSVVLHRTAGHIYFIICTQRVITVLSVVSPVVFQGNSLGPHMGYLRTQEKVLQTLGAFSPFTPYEKVKLKFLHIHSGVAP